MRKNDHKTVHKTYLNTLGVPHCHTDKGSSSITDNMITFNGISVYNILNFKFICRKVLFSMYYVIFMWATGGIKFWESAISSITY
jgi:hypothetical protein